MKKLICTVTVLIIGTLMPLGIWVAAINAFYQSRKSRRVTAEALPGLPA